LIRTENLRKIFRSRRDGTVTALDGVSLTCRDGEVYALLGPNGAGKTTMLRILSTLIEPTAGAAWVNELSVTRDKKAIRHQLGVVSYETGVYERMTPREIAFFFGRLNGLGDAEIRRNLDYVVELLRMGEFVDRRTDDFSTGMKQKTVIMRALITDPKILIFDEPTAGLDILTAKRVTDYIDLLKREGRTILFATHILREAEKLADTIGIIHDGRLAAEGTLDELRRRTGRIDLEEIFFSLVENEEERALEVAHA